MSATVTRFAPSPTGHLHLGHAYSAWFTRQSVGEGHMLLRIEDIDQERSRLEYTEALIDDLQWLGIDWHGEPMIQSERGAAYNQALEALHRLDLTYRCFCSRRQIATEVARMSSAPHGPDGPLYPGTCRPIGKKESARRAAVGEPFVWRLNVAEATKGADHLTFIEHGERLPAHPERFGDIVLARRDALASYHMCCVVDDAAQRITLVTRGEDLREATGIQRLLQELLGLPEPMYAHHGLVVDEQGKRLAKRHDSLSIRSLRQQGMSPEDVVALAQRSLEVRQWER